jgi:hypothetical protein
MQRSSESIAALATALAKAQGELVNPEKSSIGSIRVGTGRGQGGGEGVERLFRYAPLSSGLDIVRKTLGQHEIATIQTTAIDRDSGQVNLTTLLAHTSGEWIASDWPVCPIAETANPRRMGAALTYARRYALFTLVGIAGEDDLDAPDQGTSTVTPILVPDKPEGPSNGRLNGGHLNSAADHPQRATVGHGAKAGLTTLGASALDPETSVRLRDQLLADLNNLVSGEDAALWAKRCLPEKNRLLSVDAKCIEESFATKLASLLGGAVEPAPPRRPKAKGLAADSNTNTNKKRSKKHERSKLVEQPIDKSLLALPEPRRVRDRNHVRHVAKKPCLVCGRQPSDAHHLRFAQSRALGRKVSDEFTVPLCRGHHREVHRHGDEAAWWESGGIDPLGAARSLWLETHPLSVALDATCCVQAITSLHGNRSNIKDRRPRSEQSHNYETNPIVAARMP